MKIIWVLVVSGIWISVGSSVARAQSSSQYVPSCTPSAVDVQALPPVLSGGRGGHLFVLELQNIGKTACMLSQPSVELLPPSDPYNSLFLAANRGQEDGRNEYAPKRLEASEWAHIVFAWMSHSAPEVECNQYSELKLHISDLNPNMHVEDRAAIDVRNLWIRSCPSVYVSGYRKGRYSPQSTLSTTWLNWWQPAVSDESSFPRQPLASEVLSVSPLLALHAPVERTMLNDHLALRLKFPRAADGCAFRLLRKRESSGATIISVQQCPSRESALGKPVPQHLESGISRLDISGLDMAPRQTGPVEYDVLGTVASSSSTSLARAHIELIVRDPTLPAQAQILDPLPPCKASQLHFVSRDPVVSERLKTLRAYEATNASDETCSLAGVPTLRFLDEEGVNEPFVPKPCPNCDNDLFKVRPNGRIDLKHGDTAHFLVGATSIDTQEDPWMHCQRAASVELAVTPSDKPVVLPMDAGVCAAIDISAWRQGPYDGDRLNLHQAELAHASESIAKPAIPAECDKPQLLVHGWPYPVEGTHEPQYSLSMEQHQFIRDESIPLYLWTNNSTDHSLELGGCNRPAVLKAGGYVVYDAYGHRVLDKRQIASDERCKADPSGYVEPLICTATVIWSLPPHTCIVSPIDLAKLYDLPPGEYTVSTRDPGDTASCPRRNEAPYNFDPARDIRFTVLQP